MICHVDCFTASALFNVMISLPSLLRPGVPKDVNRPQMFISGEIQNGSFPDYQQACCSWRFVHRSGSAIVEGDTSGESVVAMLPSFAPGFLTWNHPVDIHMAIRSFDALPSFQFTIRGKDHHCRSAFIGYGSANVPLQPGLHHIKVRIWRPLAKPSWMERARVWLLDAAPELVDAGTEMTSIAKRGSLSYETVGHVSLCLNVIIANFADNGVYVGQPGDLTFS